MAQSFSGLMQSLETTGAAIEEDKPMATEEDFPKC